ncbi:hypothetical protein ACLB1O_23350 [Escherichia coli]
MQDAFAARSHARAWAATQSAAFKNEIIPTRWSRCRRRPGAV